MSAGPVYSFKPSPYSSHRRLLSALPERGDGLRVLDVGCGPGYLAADLARRGFQVTGIERAGGAGTGFPATVRLIECDLESGLPELAGRFDFILCADILEHLRFPGQLLQMLRGVLAPQGVLLASLPNSGNLYFRLVVLSGRFPKHDRGLFDRTHLHFFTWDGWSQLFAASGFSIDDRMVTGIPVGLALGNSDSLPVRCAEAISYQVARLWPRLFAYQFLVRARACGSP